MLSDPKIKWMRAVFGTDVERILSTIGPGAASSATASGKAVPDGSAADLPAGRDAAPGGAPTLDSIVISPAGGMIDPGGQKQFAATGDYDDGSSRIITGEVDWTSSEASIAIDDNGLATAGLVSAAGTIKATDPATGVFATVQLQVAPPRPEPTLVKITIAPVKPTFVGSASFPQMVPRQQFTATGVFSDNSTGDVTRRVKWESSANNVVGIDPNGLATLGATAGTARISATDPKSAGAGVAVGDWTLATVTIPLPSALEITPASLSMDAGDAKPLTVSVVYSDGHKLPLAGAGKSAIAWTATGGIYVDADGIAHARHAGASKVTATHKPTRLSATMAITVVVERSMDTPFGPFKYFVYAEKETKPLLTTAVATYNTLMPIYQEMARSKVTLGEAGQTIGEKATVLKEIDQYTSRQTKRDAITATSAEILDEGTKDFVQALATEMQGAAANVTFAVNALKRAQDTEFVRWCKEKAADSENALHAVIGAVKLATAPDGAGQLAATLDLFELVAKIDNPWAQEASKLEQEINESEVEDAVAKLQLARRTWNALKPRMKPSQERLKRAGKNAAEAWKMAETDYDQDPKNKGGFRFKNVQEAIRAAQAAYDTTGRAANAGYAAQQAAKALYRPSEAPNSWMADVAADQKIVEALVKATHDATELAYARHGEARDLLKRYKETYAAAKAALASATGSD